MMRARQGRAQLAVPDRRGPAAPRPRSEDLLASLPRRDQRARGWEYVQGLLRTRGRKSIRNIAAATGGDATEQRLHHFISDSTWNWHAVRRELARRRCRGGAVSAYVLRDSVIPKSGNQTVGVSRRYQPTLGSTVNAQVACGLWAVGTVTAPVSWSLFLPDTTTVESTLVDAFRSVSADLAAAPVVVDARSLDVGAVVDELMSLRSHLVVQVPAELTLDADDATLPRSVTHRPAAELVRGVRPQPMPGRRTASPGVARRVRVSAPRRADGRPVDPSRRLQLVGLDDHDRAERSYWLVALPRERLGDLPALVTALDDLHADDIGDEVGLHDFVGRSFDGWHRHMTLASIAYAIRARQRPVDRAAPRSRTG